MMPHEHLEIKITQCCNGFIIEKSQWIDGTCASTKEVLVANDAKQVSSIVYGFFNKG